MAPQSGLDGRTFSYRRGRLLGGSSTISESCGSNALHVVTIISIVDYMIHQYGSSADFDKIAEIADDVGWKWDSVKQHIKKVLSFDSLFLLLV